MSATASPTHPREDRLLSQKEESVVSFKVELEEALELPHSAEAETTAATTRPSAAQVPPRHGDTTAAEVVVRSSTGSSSSSSSTSNSASTSSRMIIRSAGAKRVPSISVATVSASAGGGGVTSPVATSTNTTATSYTTTTRTAAPALAATWENTSAAQRLAEARASRDDDFNPMILCPLQNLGNTCYFNSGVQLLINCPALVYAARHSPFARSAQRNSPIASHVAGRLVPPSAAVPPTTTTRLCLRGGAATHALFEEFAALLAHMEAGCSPHERGLSPLRALDALARAHPQFEGRSQQDAAEVMTSLLASLEEEGGQYVELTQLLQSFEEDACAMRRAASSLASSHRAAAPVAARSSTGPAPAPADAATTTAAAAARPSGTALAPVPAPSQPRPPLLQRHHGEPYHTDDYSQPSPLSPPDGVDAALPGPRSAHLLTALRLMDQVNRENEGLERRVRERQGRPGAGAFRPPRLHFNPLLDGFRGYSLSQVECHSCRAVSRVVSAFNGLLVDVPTAKQRRRFAAMHPGAPRRLGADGQPRPVKRPCRLTWWNPLSLCAAAWAQIKRLFQEPLPYPLWLDECLDIHFAPELLHGANQYRCESCGRTSEATKSESLLALPEYLLVHMKRFEAGRFFHSKKSDPVFFPAAWQPLTEARARQAPHTSGAGAARSRPPLPEFLDLRRYLHSSVAAFAEPIPPCLAEPDSDAPRPPPPPPSGTKVESSSRSIPTTYTLDGIVNHHGGYDGGHYTVFLYKMTEERQAWVYISDDEMERAEDVVATDTEYVLLYRRQCLVQAAPQTDEAEQLRRKARYYLSPSPSSPETTAAAAAPAAPPPPPPPPRCPSSFSSTSSVDGVKAAPSPAAAAAAAAATATTTQQVYISRMWLQRAAFLHEPGPIVNRLCYCRPEERGRVSMFQTLFPATLSVPGDTPHIHGPPVEWFYVAISQGDYDIFYTAFGGNAAVTASEYESLRAMQVKFCADIDAAERQRQRQRGGGGGSAVRK
ncbi:cysteine peptidase, Clan CA, family C19 [Novymonas esmeraldas]|uniref:Cysteine peptidase, Clan CA, family C19 n=1 Tax=Novymonas esmeraldas TaxID=1808958 RepID=A0AAW0ETF2_9TRYP